MERADVTRIAAMLIKLRVAFPQAWIDSRFSGCLDHEAVMSKILAIYPPSQNSHDHLMAIMRSSITKVYLEYCQSVAIETAINKINKASELLGELPDKETIGALELRNCHHCEQAYQSLMQFHLEYFPFVHVPPPPFLRSLTRLENILNGQAAINADSDSEDWANTN